ncbi:MAG: hypothetical protein LBD54_02045 [Puniceicoccales bacterium]|nr:hypothetical protein [Puniceicoccales bacterium]
MIESKGKVITLSSQVVLWKKSIALVRIPSFCSSLRPGARAMSISSRWALWLARGRIASGSSGMAW